MRESQINQLMVWCFTTYRLVLSSWIYTAILSQCMMLSHWRKSQMPTWTNIYGMKQTRDVCFLHGSNQRTLNLLHSLRTNGAKVCTPTLSSWKKCLLLFIAISWKGAKVSPKFMKRFGHLQSSLGAGFRRYRCRMHIPLPAGRFETSQGEIGWGQFFYCSALLLFFVPVLLI